MNLYRFINLIKRISLVIFLSLFIGVPSFAQNEDLNWDNPVKINKSDGRFPITINNGDDSYVFWQKVNVNTKKIQLMVRHYTDESTFRERQLFGTFDYSGEVPELYTVAMAKNGTIIVAAPSSEGITIFTSRDKCETFFKKVIRTPKAVVGPKVYITNDGRFRLFYSLVDYKKTETKKTSEVKIDSEVDDENNIEEFTIIEENQIDSKETELLVDAETDDEDKRSDMESQSFQLYYIDSFDGQTWTEGVQLAMPEGVKNPFAPCLIPTSGGDLVVFQAQVSSGGLQHYQLYRTATYDGKNWESPKLLYKSSNTTQDQRPVMYKYNGKNYIVWEESDKGVTSLCMANIGINGLTSNIETISEINNKINGRASRPRFFEYEDELYVTWFDAVSGAIFLKRLVTKDGAINHEYIESINKFTNNLFPNPLILKKTDGSKFLYFVCQEKVGSTGRISILGPDGSVGNPELVPKSYKLGKRSSKYDVEISINYPKDVSGISGYVYYWGLDSTIDPEADIEKLQKSGSASTLFRNRAEEDGIYTLKVRIVDGAGNWSKPVGIDYYHDITPPSKPVIDPSSFDDYGFVKSNEFNLKWFASTDENKREGENDKNAAGYTYELEYLGKIPETLAVNKTHSITMSKTRVNSELDKIRDRYKKQINKSYKFKPVIETSGISTKKYVNLENGAYRFSIAAIDEVGNISESTSELVFINKYKPQTVIFSTYSEKTKDAGIKASIRGSGFTYEGIISKIYIDEDGVKNKDGHYDLELSRDKGDFKVTSDNSIVDIKIGTALKDGDYKVGVYHTDRGLYFTNTKMLNIGKTGTVVFSPEYEYKPKYRELHSRKLIVINSILIVLIVALVISIIIAFIFIFSGYFKEKIILNKEINSLIKGDVMPSLKQKTKKNRQRSLRGKIVGFTVVLIILIVGIITVINVRSTLINQGKTLSDSLLNRIDVLLGSVDSGITNYMPNTEIIIPERNEYDEITNEEQEKNAAIQNIETLPDQSSALPEAKYITILGYKDISSRIKDDSGKLNYIWATNDPLQDEKFENKDDEDNQFVHGITQIVYPEQQLNEDLYTIVQRVNSLNDDAKTRTKTISDEINELRNERLDSLLSRKEFTKSDTLKNLEAEFTKMLSIIEQENSGSVPQFNGINLDMNTTDFLFYKPVLYRSVGEQTSESKLLHALIVLEINVQNLQDDLRSQVMSIIYSGIILALIAIIVGAAGAWVLAGIIVSPIKKLETHIQDVGNLLTKSARERMRLQKMEIKLSSKDEVGRLGEVVNKMSSTVGKAAEDELLEADGKIVQQKFIPLEDGEGKYKLPIVKHMEEKLELYAFYKGDSDVSGDYFDYQKLDERWYIFIKCDVSGHGTPAALLVSVLSTKFREYYYNSRWSYNKNGVNLVQFVSEVNDFIYDLGTRGKFSTINISLYNKDTGELYTCNAGDNKLDIFESDKHKLRRVTLANTPAAGGVSTELVQMKGGFRVEKTMLRHGDTLFMYSDGIDEAERLVRNKDFSVKTHVVETKKFNPRENKEEIETSIEDLKEQFGEDRYRRVVEAVMNKRKFILDKEENPTKEILEFDFTNCKGTLDEAIIALASIERVFRMYKSPDVKAGDEIEIEKLLDQFLKEHFELYTTYCKPAEKFEEEKLKKKSKKTKGEVISTKKADEDLNVTRYGYVFEDKQADDITLVAIHRP